MDFTHRGQHRAVPALLSCAQIAIVLRAAERIHHPVAHAVELAILAPGSAPALPACHVDRIDLDEGCLSIPMAEGGWAGVAMGRRGMELVKHLVDQRTSGQLLVDDHGSPLLLDADTSDYAVELLGRADPRSSRFAWSIESLRISALWHLSRGGVSDEMLLEICGVTAPGTCPRQSRRTQVWVGEYWEHLLDLQTRAIVALNFLARIGTGKIDTSFATFALNECVS